MGVDELIRMADRMNEEAEMNADLLKTPAELACPLCGRSDCEEHEEQVRDAGQGSGRSERAASPPARGVLPYLERLAIARNLSTLAAIAGRDADDWCGACGSWLCAEEGHTVWINVDGVRHAGVAGPKARHAYIRRAPNARLSIWHGAKGRSKVEFLCDVDGETTLIVAEVMAREELARRGLRLASIRFGF